jgi:hypothetical protein
VNIILKLHKQITNTFSLSSPVATWPPTTSRSFVGAFKPIQSPTHPHCTPSFRPLNSTELREGPDIVASFNDDLTTVQMRSQALGSGPESNGFTFDKVFPMGTTQLEVFDYGVKEYVLQFATRVAHSHSLI